MRSTRPRLTVFRVILAVAVAAIATHLVTDRIKGRSSSHRERCLAIADNHARSGRAYRGQNLPATERVASWHEQMQRVFENAAEHPGDPLPNTREFPPDGWVPPETLKP